MLHTFAKTAPKLLLVVFVAQILSACSASQPPSLGMVDGKSNPRYSHLYAAMETNAYKSPVFSWVGVPSK